MLWKDNTRNRLRLSRTNNQNTTIYKVGQNPETDRKHSNLFSVYKGYPRNNIFQNPVLRQTSRENSLHRSQSGLLASSFFIDSKVLLETTERTIKRFMKTADANRCSPRKGKMLESIRQYMQKVRDNVIFDYIKNQAKDIKVADSRIEQCISHIKEASKLPFPTLELRKGKSMSKSRPQKVCVRKSLLLKPLKKERCEESGSELLNLSTNRLQSLEGRYKKIVKDSKAIEKEVKTKMGKVMYNYRYCRAMAKEIADKGQDLLDPNLSFDYYIWQAAKRSKKSTK